MFALKSTTAKKNRSNKEFDDNLLKKYFTLSN